MENIVKKSCLILLALLVLVLNLRCKSPYISPVSSVSVNILHIEGFINTSGDTTLVTLSRTVKLTDSANSKPELNAVVTVQGDDGTAYQLTETGSGNYIYPDFGFLSNSTNKYRLGIVTSDGKTYQSDFVAVKNSPPIDSIYYKVNANGIEVFSNSHDPNNNTRYYRWDYEETWVVHSYYDSHLELHNTPKDTITIRPASDEIDTCWVNGKSSTVLLNSSAKLSQDIIADNPIAFISSTSEKFRSAYSLLLRQYALTKDAFDYWQNLKKNTEQLGSIFDVQPSQIKGNIHGISNPSEPVLGYVSMGAATKKRLFIYKNQLPSAWQPVTPYISCGLDTVPIKNLPGLFQYSAIPVEAIYDKRRVLIGYSFSISKLCADCTLRGTNIKPSYWISK